MYTARLDRLYAAIEDAGLSGMAFNPGPSLTYLTGLHFHLMERPVVLLVKPGMDPVIILPELEQQKLRAAPYALRGFSYGENPADWDAVFSEAVQAIGFNGGKVGIEPRQIRVLEYRMLRSSAPMSSFPDGGNVVAVLRAHKDAAEVEIMRKAVKIAQQALLATIPQVKIGMAESEIAAELTIQLLRHGAQPGLPFSPIVSGGLNAANPHATPSERKLQAGDMLVIDWGAGADDYISDLTRTFAIGRVDPEWKKIHQIVQEANAAGRAAAKPGAACAHVDQAARSVIDKAGYGQYFVTRTGHGIGMEVHEDPYIRSDNLQVLEPGMAFTVEPGIYIPDHNGVRIEDNVVITENGAECLSDLPRELQVLG